MSSGVGERGGKKGIEIFALLSNEVELIGRKSVEIVTDSSTTDICAPHDFCLSLTIITSAHTDYKMMFKQSLGLLRAPVRSAILSSSARTQLPTLARMLSTEARSKIDGAVKHHRYSIGLQIGGADGSGHAGKLSLDTM